MKPQITKKAFTRFSEIKLASLLEITKAINNYTPRLQKLEARVAAATETTQEYYKRIQNVAAIAKSEADRTARGIVSRSFATTN